MAECESILTPRRRWLRLSVVLFFALSCLVCSSPDSAWEEAVSKDSVASYTAFLEKYPKSEYVTQANERLAELHFEIAHTQDTVEVYRKYLELFPDTAFAAKATARLGILEEWHAARLADVIPQYVQFLLKHPDADFAAEAESRAESLAIQKAVDRVRSNGGAGAINVSIDNVVSARREGRISPDASAEERQFIMDILLEVTRILGPEMAFSIPEVQPFADGLVAQITYRPHPESEKMFIASTELPRESLVYKNALAPRSVMATGEGTVYRFAGTLRNWAAGWVFEGDEADPLCFVQWTGPGLTYFCGRGTVVAPDGTSYRLPLQRSEHKTGQNSVAGKHEQ